MTLWLKWRSSWNLGTKVNLDTSPCPCIMAMGIGGSGIGQYYIENDMRIEMEQSNGGYETMKGNGVYKDITDSPAFSILASKRTHIKVSGPYMPPKPRLSKPPYAVPYMSEIKQIESNGYKVISTFSGCGGSSLGYRMAGFDVIWANEFIKAARDSYRANKSPGCIIDPRDIRQVTPEDILDATSLKVGELDLLDGSPPCAAFSTAGKRESGWGKVKKYSDTKQRVDDLFFEYIRILRGLNPKTFVAENVSGLIKGSAKGYFIEIIKALKDSGYRVGCKVLDAQWLGVPQMRQRTIFIGVREDIGLDPVHPSPLPYRYSVLDAIHDLLKPENQSIVEPDSDISRFAIGDEHDKLKPGEASEKYFSLVKSNPNTPSPTICASHGNPSTAGVTHFVRKRKFSIAELKRICSFPDDFVLTGTYAQQWERLGRSVPPVMMKSIADCVREHVLDKIES